MSPAYPGLLAAAMYVVAFFMQANRLGSTQTESSRLLQCVITAGAIAHAATVYLVMDHSAGLVFGLFSVASLVSLAIVTFTLTAALWQPVQNLYLIVLPLAALAIVAALIAPGELVPASAFTPGLVIHVLLSLLAYTVLALAACQAVVLGIAERMFRTKSTLTVLRLLPPLETMESMLFQQVWIGIVLLSAAIVSGFLFLNNMFAQQVVHHTVLASASWVVFLILLIGRHAFGWRGATATRWTLTGFALLVLAYFGSKFVLEFLLGSP